MDTDADRQRSTLRQIARRAMIERGLLPDFSSAALAELDGIRATAAGSSGWSRDMRNLPWASIDNDDSRDLDQLTVAETIPGGAVKILVAIADVDALVKQGSAIDDHARQNTTSVYTAAEIFPMLPEKLSTDLTSLGYREDRPAIVIEMVFGEEGSLRRSDLYGATVRNRAKLAYNSVAAWLEGKGPAPDPIAVVEGLAENLRIQDRVAQQLKSFRHEHGALGLETIEARPVFDGDVIRDLEADRSGITPTQRPRTGDTPISSLNGCSRPPSRDRRCRMAATNWWSWPATARKRKTMRTRSSAGSENPRRPC